MISRYGIYLPLPAVAALLAFVYGLSIRHAWISAILTFGLVMFGGWKFGAVGQISAVIVSAVVIFLVFSRPEHRRRADEDAKRAREAEQLPNEEDL